MDPQPQEEQHLETLALVRLGLGALLEQVPQAVDGSLVAVLVRAKLLGPARAMAIGAYVERHRGRCECGRAALLPEGAQETRCGCGRVVARPGPAPTPAATLPGPLAIGSRLGDLELVDVLGRGAFGVVFKARHTKLGRFSAVKVVPSSADRRRFEREVEALARLRHPGIARIHALVPAGSHGVAFEMELIEGEALAARLQRGGALDWREAASLVARVARAVDHVHRHGVLHRDLKPSNILVRNDGSPVVVDLGLARFIDRTSSLTRDGAILGTVAYLAPEALGGSWSTAADVYALGVILYEAASGSVPFRASTLVALLARVFRGDAPPLAAPGAPPDLDAVRARAMAVLPRDRYATAADLATDLEAVLAGRPLRGRRARTRRGPLVGLVLVLASAAALTLALARTGPAAAPLSRRDLLERARREAPTDARAALGSLDALARVELADTSATLAAAELALKLGDPERAHALLEGSGEAPGSRRGALLRARTRRARGDAEGALALLRQRDVAPLVSGSPLAVALLLDLGRREEALACARAQTASTAERGESLVSLGQAQLALGELVAARETFRSIPPDGRAAALAGEAEALLALGAPEDALTVADEARRLDPGDPWAYLVRAGAGLQLGEETRADELSRAVRALLGTGRACPEGTRLVASLAEGRSSGRWAGDLVLRVRTAALEARAHPALVAGVRSATRAAASALPRSASARTARALALLGPGGDARAALAEAEAAVALDPTEESRLTRALALEASGEVDRARSQLVELAPSAEVLLALARVARLGGDHGAAAAAARRAVERATDRRSRDQALALAGGEGPLAPSRVEGRAVVRATLPWGSLSPDSTRARFLEEAIAAEPWEPVHRVLRAEGLWDGYQIARVVLDSVAAGLLDDRYALEAVVPLTRHGQFAKLNVPAPLLVLPSDDTVPPAEARGLAIARSLIRLGARPPHSREPAAWHDLVAAVHSAESARPAAALHALRALALEALSAPRAAERERLVFSSLVPPSAALALDGARALLAQDPARSALELERARVLRVEEARAESGPFPVRDLTGVALLGHVAGLRVPWQPYPETERLAPAKLGATGWRHVGNALEAEHDGATIEVTADALEVELLLRGGWDRSLPVRVESGSAVETLDLAGAPGSYRFVLAAGLSAPARIRASFPAGTQVLFAVVWRRTR